MSEANLRVTSDEDGDFTLLDFLIVLAKRKKAIIAVTFVGAVVGAFISFVLPSVYTASARILPPQPTQSAAAGMLAQIGAIGGGLGGAFGIKSPSDLYVGILKSRTVANALISRFNLQAEFQKKLLSDARNVLASMTKVIAGKDGMIVIEVEGKNPKQVAKIANGYVDELHKLTSVLAVTEASQRRLFYERQLIQAKDKLTKSETLAKQAMQRGGIAPVEGRARAMIEAAARLRGDITVKEVQIGAMRTFATERNPEFLALQEQIQVMKRELANIEGDGTRGAPAHVSAQGIESAGLLRDVKYYETIYDLLAKQYELAKIDEARDSSLIQVLDEAVPPDHPSGPRWKIIVLLSALLACIAAICWAFIAEAVQRVQKDPFKAEQLLLLHRAVWGK